MKDYLPLNSYLQCREMFQKRLELSRKFLICQNACLSLYDLAFVLEIHLYVGRKLVWNSIWIFLVATKFHRTQKQDFGLRKSQKECKNCQRVHFSDAKNRIMVFEKSQKNKKAANAFIFQTQKTGLWSLKKAKKNKKNANAFIF